MSLRTAIGHALYRLPAAVRRGVPAVVRDDVRRRVGPFAPWEAGFVPTPAPLLPGAVTGPPDFVGIGVQKAGTTWWFDLVTAHPDVFHGAELHKERHYFARFATDAFGPGDIRGYHALFPRPRGSLTGEWTPDYLYQPWVAPLLAEAAPGARLVVLLRDPVERFLSGLAHSPIRPATHLGNAMAEAVARGYYADALRRWKDHFTDDQLLVLQYERCVADPASQLERTYRFLGLEHRYRPAGLGHDDERVPRTKPALDPEARNRLVDIYASDVAALAELVPDLELGLWTNFAP